jgi:hypothetical protein
MTRIAIILGSLGPHQAQAVDTVLDQVVARSGALTALRN